MMLCLLAQPSQIHLFNGKNEEVMFSKRLKIGLFLICSFFFAIVGILSISKIGIAKNFAIQPPFIEGQNGSSYRMTSYFDHNHPNYVDDDEITIYNGESTPDGVPYSYNGHPGYDWATPTGTEILAVASGQVVARNANTPYGNQIIIDHKNGYYTRYAHLDEFAIGIFDWVDSGQRIGWSGDTGNSTGPHLHFGVYQNSFLPGLEENGAIDPYGWTGGYDDPLKTYTYPSGVQGKSSICLWRSAVSDTISCYDTIYEDEGDGTIQIGVWGELTAFDGNGDHMKFRYKTNEQWIGYFWHFNICEPQYGSVYAWIPNHYHDTENAVYQINTANEVINININQSQFHDQWVLLGTFLFTNQNPWNNYVYLSAMVVDENPDEKFVAADSIKFRTFPINLPIVNRFEPEK
jgi:hypothetical protein